MLLSLAALLRALLGSLLFLRLKTASRTQLEPHMRRRNVLWLETRDALMPARIYQIIADNVNALQVVHYICWYMTRGLGVVLSFAIPLPGRCGRAIKTSHVLCLTAGAPSGMEFSIERFNPETDHRCCFWWSLGRTTAVINWVQQTDAITSHSTKPWSLFVCLRGRKNWALPLPESRWQITVSLNRLSPAVYGHRIIKRNKIHSIRDLDSV